MSLFQFYRYLALEESQFYSQDVRGLGMALSSHHSGLGTIPWPGVNLLQSFFSGSFGLSPSAKNQHSKLRI